MITKVYAKRRHALALICLVRCAIIRILLLLVLASMFSLPAIAKPLSAQVRRAIKQVLQAGSPNNLAALLAQHKLSVNSVIRARGDTLLHMAVNEGTPEVVEYLLDNNANVNATDSYGYTPLDEAQALNKTEIVALLENAGAVHGEGLRPIKAVPTLGGALIPFAPFTMDEPHFSGPTSALTLGGALIPFAPFTMDEPDFRPSTSAHSLL